MPRRSREKSTTGMYHVMLRGNEKKDIFRERPEKQKLLKTMMRIRWEGGFELYAYCIMDNHLHLCFNEGETSLSCAVQRLATIYARYYNDVHDRVGHVFQDRYKSQPIGNEPQLLNVIRYIHNNPVKAGMAERPELYTWSSYRDYLRSVPLFKEHEIFLKDTEWILGLFSQDKKAALQAFQEYTHQPCEDQFLDMHQSEDDVEDAEIMKKLVAALYLKGMTVEDLKENKGMLKETIQMLKQEHHLSIRRIADLLNVSKNLVHRSIL